MLLQHQSIGKKKNKMGFKGLLSKIEPRGCQEKTFYTVLSNIRTLDEDLRSVTYAFMNEDTSFACAQTIAESAINWLRELSSGWDKFESSGRVILESNRVKFIDWVRNNGNSYKKTQTSFIARSGNKFIAEYDLATNMVSVIDDFYSDNKILSTLKLYNELGV